MEFERQLELIHLQITGNCNLRCYFCGQWGHEGFFSRAAGTPLSREEWFGFMERLAEMYASAAQKPSVIFWGGEPLCWDSETSKEIMALFKQLNHDNETTIIIVTHDPNVGAQADRLVHILDGRLTEDVDHKPKGDANEVH